MRIKVKRGVIIQDKNARIEWIPAIVVSFSYICGCIGINGISIILAFFLWLMAITFLFRGTYRLAPNIVLLIMCLILLFFISFLRISNIQYAFDYFQRFLLYNVAALIIGTQKLNKEGMLKGTTIIGFVFLPIIITKDFFAVSSVAAMGASYTCLPILIASFLAFLITTEVVYKFLSLANIIVILFKYATVANRGIWVIVLSFVVIMTYMHLVKIKVCGYRKILAYAFLIFVGVGAAYGLRNLETITLWLYNTIDRLFHIQVYALWKIMLYFRKGDIANGRGEIFSSAIDVIRSNLLFGRGIGFYESISGGTYCHNLLLQAACEGGIFMLIPLVVYILKVLRQIFVYPLKNIGTTVDRLWIVFIFCAGIEMLFMSAVYWTYPLFWFMTGSFIRETKEQRYKGTAHLRYENVEKSISEASG